MNFGLTSALIAKNLNKDALQGTRGCDVKYEQPALHGLIDELPNSWTAERRNDWLNAVTKVVDLKVKLEVSAPKEP